MFKIVKKEIQFGNKTLILETGKVARQATAAVMARMGDTMVLCTVVADRKAKEDIDFFPLSVHYQERYYAGGRFPGGFHKRESRPTKREVLTSRLIDRPVRPLFPEGFCNEIQIICTVLSYDPDCQPDIIGLIGASAALSIARLPFNGPVGAARVGLKDGEFLLNPSQAELTEGGKQLDLIVAGTKDAVLMVESEAKELSEEVMLQAVMFGHAQFQGVISAINEMAEEVGKEAWPVELKYHNNIITKVEKLVGKQLKTAYQEVEKLVRYQKINELKEEALKKLVEEEELSKPSVEYAFESLKSKIVRDKAIDEKKRIDGRSPSDIRPIVSEVDILPRVHGSALFTRGETQALVVVTLGTGEDEQLVDDLEGLRKDRLLLHYNFPSYSVGEIGRMGAPGRREIGHGELALRAISALAPSKEEFPYTIRLVSEITESNGSSSMATVCGVSSAMMSAGIPLKSPIAGIAMGLIKEGKNFVVLSDIMGDEDHLGDMDFKVAGTKDGITALQMDIKIDGITEEIMKIALSQAKDGREHILGKMAETLTESKGAISKYAPQIHSFKVPKEKIGEIIGPGGKVIKDIIEKTKVKIDITDDGTVNIASTEAQAMEAAIKMVTDIVAVAEVGKMYEGKISRIVEFGLFVNILRNTDGLVHVSEMNGRPNDFKEGQMVKVKVVSVDNNNRIKLTMKINGEASMQKPEALENTVSNADNEPGDNNQPEAKFSRPQSKGRSFEERKNSSKSRSRRPEHSNKQPQGDERKSRGESTQSSTGKKRRFF